MWWWIFSRLQPETTAAKIIKIRQEYIKRLDIEVIANADMLYGRRILQSFLGDEGS